MRLIHPKKGWRLLGEPLKPPTPARGGQASRPVTGQGRRRLWHLLGGSFFPLLILFAPHTPALLLVGAATGLALTVDILRLRFPGLHQEIGRLLLVKESEATGLSGSSYLLLAILIVFLLFPKAIAVAALLLAAIADPVAGVVGERWGRCRLRKKSLEGAMAFLGVALGVGLALNQAGVGLPLSVAAAGALAAAAAELLSLPPDDNLTVPLASAGIMALTTWQVS